MVGLSPAGAREQIYYSMSLEKFYDIDKKGIVRIRKWKKNGIFYNSLRY